MKRVRRGGTRRLGRGWKKRERKRHKEEEYERLEDEEYNREEEEAHGGGIRERRRYGTINQEFITKLIKVNFLQFFLFFFQSQCIGNTSLQGSTKQFHKIVNNLYRKFTKL
jgi:hypothetical protein